jgi:HEAT repeat protein
MPIEFQCHDCDASYRVEERLAGKQARCRHCGAVMDIPRVSRKSAAPEANGDIDLRFRDEPDDADDPIDPARPTKPGSTIIASPVLKDDAPAPASMPVVAWNPDPKPPPSFAQAWSGTAAQSARAAAAAPSAHIVAGTEMPSLAPPPPPQQPLPTLRAQPTYRAAPAPRRSRRYRPSTAVGLDALTPWTLLLFLALVIAQHVRLYVSAPAPPAGQPQLITPGVLTISAIVELFMFFALVAPLVLLAVFITSRIMKFELPGAAYARACTVAATPAVLGALLVLIPFWNVRRFSAPDVIRIVMIAVIVHTVTYYVMKHLFEMEWVESIVGWVFTLPLLLLGGFVTFLAWGATTVGGMLANSSTANSAVASSSSPGITSVLPSSSSTDASVTLNGARVVVSPPAPVDPDQQKLDALRRETAELMNGGYMGGSREAAEARLRTMRDSARSVQSTKGSAPEYAELIGRLDDLDRRAAALPSERPDPAIAQPPDAKERWDTADAAEARGLSRDELAVAPGIAMRRPADALLDLKSSASDPAGLLWRWKPAFTRMTIATPARNDPTQQRPWIVPRSIARGSMGTSKLLVIESDQPQITSGTIGGIPFTRVADAPSEARADRRITYVALIDNNKWLLIQLLSTDGDATVIATFDAAVRTIRRLRAGELIGDPFTPSQIARRLVDDPDRAIPLLKQAGPAAEDAVLEVLKSDNRRAKAGAIEVLRAIGTDKSLPAIREIAAGSDTQLSGPAREVLRRLAPNEADAIALAVLDLKSGADVLRRREALKTLAAAIPDESRRKEVAQAIQDVVFAEDLAVRDDAAKALANWAKPDVVPRMLPWLDERESMFHRQTALTVLPATKDRRAVFPIVRWIIKEPEAVVKALTAMGPVAEDEVVKLLKERDPAVRKNAARILEEIGGQKSLISLQRASTDPRDPGAAEAARRALETVRERIKSSRASAATTRP